MPIRDEKTRFEHQRRLQERRPKITPQMIQQAKWNERLRYADSFNLLFSKREEVLIALALRDGSVSIVRTNPDVVLNLAISLLKEGTKLGWFQVDFVQSDRPKPN